MQLATWNVNSLKVRLPQVLDWLAANPVDALCLQELKLDQDKFPVQAFTEIGYHAAWAGQKTYNGVAVLSREPGVDVVRDIPDFEDHQRRVLAITLPFGNQRIRVICLQTCLVQGVHDVDRPRTPVAPKHRSPRGLQHRPRRRGRA